MWIFGSTIPEKNRQSGFPKPPDYPIVMRKPWAAFRAIHYTVLIVFVVAFVMLTNLVDRSSLRFLSLIVR